MLPIHLALHDLDFAEAKRLIVSGIDINSKDNEGDTPLHLAADLGNLDIVELLLKSGAEIDLHDGWDTLGRTALHRAVIKGNIEVINVLIQAGADINAKQWDGYTALDLAKTAKNAEIVSLLRKLGANDSPLNTDIKRIIITGAAGFIGFHLSRHLLNEDWKVIGIDNLNDYYDVTLKEARLRILQDHKGFTFNRLDLADRASLEELFQRESIDQSVPVIHLAAQAGVRYGLENPGAYIHSNIIGFFNLIDLCKEAQVPHFLYASSSSVYGGNQRMPFSEGDNVDHPVSFYAATKKNNELLAHVYSYTYNLPTTGLRFFSVYGPWGRPDMALFLFTKAIIEGKPIQVFNNGDLQRDFTYIDDIVEGVAELIEHPPTSRPDWDALKPDPATSWVPYRVLNIGNHRSEPLMEYISVIEKALGRKATIEMKPMQTGDVKASYADINRIYELISFIPKTTIQEGIPRFVEWYREYYGQ